MKWSVPKIWEDATVYILGGGPSLNKIDFSLIAEKRIIAVNNAYGDRVTDEEGKLLSYKPRSFVDICWWGDVRWWNIHYMWLREFKGIIATCNMRNEFAKPEWRRVKVVNRIPRSGMNKEPNGVCWNKCSGLSAINLAYLLGARRVVLLGYDMQIVNGEKNWHDDHRENPQNPFWRFLQSVPYIATAAKNFGLEILNATENSAIEEKYFKQVKLEEVL